MDNRDKYRRFCADTGEYVPLFLTAWWLDAACGEDGWDVGIVANGQAIQAVLPYLPRRRQGFRMLTQPALTPFLGPWMRPSQGKRARRYSDEKALMQALIEQLPAYDLYQQNWSPLLTNWLPFFWSGFQQTTRYTYVLNDLADEAELWRGLSENIRRDIRKASGRFGLTVEADASPDAFLKLNAMTFARQDRRAPYSEAYVRRIDAACAERGCRRILVARDAEGRAHAGVFIVWDADRAYYLAGGGDPDLRNSGAASLCLWEAIRFACGVTRRFDFEGSMIEEIERFFRAFGAEQVPYFQVSHTPSRRLSAWAALRRMMVTK